MITGYIIKAQGYEPVRVIYPTLKAVQKEVRTWVKQDVRDCRRKFGTAVVSTYEGRMWQVSASSDSHSPMWSRYTIHAVDNFLNWR